MLGDATAATTPTGSAAENAAAAAGAGGVDAGTASLSFDQMMERDRAEGTKKFYKGLCKHFIQFLRVRNEELVRKEGDELDSVDLEGVKAEDLKAFFNHISIKRMSVRKDGVFSDPVPEVNGKYVLNSASYVGTYRSALKWWYELLEIQVPTTIMEQIGRFTSGFRRVKNQRRQDGEEEGDEGKQPMQFSGYEWVAKQAMLCNNDFNRGVFGWVFLLFAWNLISRGRNVGNLMFEHLSWQDDSLTVRMFVKKHDQEGKDCAPKHVFANPVKPWICPVLALAVYTFTAGPRQPGAKMLLFSNDGLEARFGQWLRGILKSHESTLQAMGLDISHIGTHSFRKGTATWLAGMVDGPSGVQIYLHAGWSLGLQKRYIFDGGGSDIMLDVLLLD